MVFGENPYHTCWKFKSNLNETEGDEVYEAFTNWQILLWCRKFEKIPLQFLKVGVVLIHKCKWIQCKENTATSFLKNIPLQPFLGLREAFFLMNDQGFANFWLPMFGILQSTRNLQSYSNLEKSKALEMEDEKSNLDSPTPETAETYTINVSDTLKINGHSFGDMIPRPPTFFRIPAPETRNIMVNWRCWNAFSNSFHSIYWELMVIVWFLGCGCDFWWLAF